MCSCVCEWVTHILACQTWLVSKGQNSLAIERRDREFFFENRAWVVKSEFDDWLTLGVRGCKTRNLIYCFIGVTRIIDLMRIVLCDRSLLNVKSSITCKLFILKNWGVKVENMNFYCVKNSPGCFFTDSNFHPGSHTHIFLKSSHDRHLVRVRTGTCTGCFS